MNEPLRLVQVGLGGWGRNWARTIVLTSDAVELRAVVDTAPEPLATFCADAGFPPERATTDLDAALDDPAVEAVLITASLPGHVPVARAALEAGKHVLIEKPFAPSVAEGRALVEVADARGLALMVSQNYRYYPAVHALLAFLAEGTLGAVTAVDVDFRKYANRAPVEGHRHYTIRHPMLLDMAIHHFDLMRHTLRQEPVTVACTAWNPPWSRFREPANARAIVTMDGSAVVSYRGSWVSPGDDTPWAGRWRLECEGGEIAWTSRGQGVEHDEVVVKPLGRRRRRLQLPEVAHVDRAGSLHAFVEAVRAGQEPPSSGRENLGSLGLTFAAIEAAEGGGVVGVGG